MHLDELDSSDKPTKYFQLKHMIVPVAVDGNCYNSFCEHQPIGESVATRCMGKLAEL
jgi:hypothetical protein